MMTRWSLFASVAVVSMLTGTIGCQEADPVTPAHEALESGTRTDQEAGPVTPAHEALEPGTQTDDFGVTLGMPASHPARRYPASDDFPTGPSIGERLPEFSLPNQTGRMVDFHTDRGDAKSIVVFYRSAVW